MDICVRALLGIGSYLRVKPVVRNSQCAWLKNLILEQFFIKYFPMRYSPKSLEINVVISRNVVVFKVVKYYSGAFYYCMEKARSISSKVQPRLVNNRK